MIITIAVMFIVLATFLLIIINMFSDYAARRDQDMRLIVSHAKNLIAETEELLMNQSQLPYSRTLVLVLHYRIIRALNKIASSGTTELKSGANIADRITNEQKIIAEIQKSYRDDIAFRPPEGDAAAATQLRTIRKLRNIIKTEIKQGSPVNPSDVQKEDHRLYLLVLKVNISNLIQKVTEMKRQHQIGSCRMLIQRGLDAIRRTAIKDDWLQEKSDLLIQLQKGLEADIENAKKAEKAKESAAEKEEKKEIEALFAEKKKW